MNFALTRHYFNHNLVLTQLNALKLAKCNYAARKGTRERARKKKVKVEIIKVGFIPHNLRQTAKNLAKSKAKVVDDSQKPDAFGNVYTLELFKQKVYDFYDAVALIKESHAPEVANEPNAMLNIDIELDMSGAKKTKFKDDFTKMVSIPRPFEHNEYRTILVFSKDVKDQETAMNCGASLAGGVELIKSIQKGDVGLHDYKYVLVHPNIMTELSSLRGLLKNKYPNIKDGTLGMDVKTMIDKFSNGIIYTAKRDEFIKSFGEIHTKIGRISMSTGDLEENLKALLENVHSAKPKRPGAFIKKVLLWSPPFKEKFKIMFEPYISENVPAAVLDDVEVADDSETIIVTEEEYKRNQNIIAESSKDDDNDEDDDDNDRVNADARNKVS